MILSSTNPLQNTIIIFTIVMAILYISRPELIYCKRTKQFRQFGTGEGKTLLSIYVLGVMLAVVLYALFYAVMKRKNKTNTQYIAEPVQQSQPSSLETICLMQQQQINSLYGQIQIMQHQLSVQLNNQLSVQLKNNTGNIEQIVI